jgi:hypothetical protein
MQPAIKAQESQEQEQPQLVAGTERGAGGGDSAQELASRKKSAGHPSCFQCAIGWDKPPKRAQKQQLWRIKKKTRRCVFTPLWRRLAQMESG